MPFTFNHIKENQCSDEHVLRVSWKIFKVVPISNIASTTYAKHYVIKTDIPLI